MLISTTHILILSTLFLLPFPQAGYRNYVPKNEAQIGGNKYTGTQVREGGREGKGEGGGRGGR